jgi:hypothetical protein
MQLPPPVQKTFWRKLAEYEEGRRVPYVTSMEREGMFRSKRFQELF